MFHFLFNLLFFDKLTGRSLALETLTILFKNCGSRLMMLITLEQKQTVNTIRVSLVTFTY
jgi:hypothetical protein